MSTEGAPRSSQSPPQPQAPGDAPPRAPGEPPPRAPEGPPPGAPREPAASPVENANRIRGLQAWTADIDRRLALRTKLILLLAAVAIGGAGAAIFLALEANRTSASQEQLNELEAQVELLEEELDAADPAVGPDAGGAGADGGADAGNGEPQGGGTGSGDPEGAGGSADAGDGAGAGGNAGAGGSEPPGPG